MYDAEHPILDEAALRELEAQYCSYGDTVHYLPDPKFFDGCEGSFMSHPRNAYRLETALGGPTRLHLLDDSYHMIHVDQERDRVAALTAAFFGEDAPYAVESLEMRSHV